MPPAPAGRGGILAEAKVQADQEVRFHCGRARTDPLSPTGRKPGPLGREMTAARQENDRSLLVSRPAGKRFVCRAGREPGGLGGHAGLGGRRGENHAAPSGRMYQPGCGSKVRPQDLARLQPAWKSPCPAARWRTGRFGSAAQSCAPDGVCSTRRWMMPSAHSAPRLGRCGLRVE